MRKAVLFIILFLCSVLAMAQSGSNKRSKTFLRDADTVLLDTLSIIPASFELYNLQGNKIDTSFYKINYLKSLLYWNKIKTDTSNSFIVKYAVYPLNFEKQYFHKDYHLIEPDDNGSYNPFEITYEKAKIDDVLSMGSLSRKGSISRGVSFGNNQDVVMNSNLDLQLSGKLNDKISILAAITDNNIPIQPDGNTQQIQDFDKVFIQLYNDNSKLIAGDFEMTKPDSYFMNFYKKAQGGSFITKMPLFDDKGREQGILKLTTSIAVSKGKFATNLFNSTNIIDGNQGPYKLHGNQNELYIIVLSGTEKVYIDGKLLVRGLDNDYTIDYNTAQITFTAKQLITKDKRISVEFQYSDKNYARSVFFVGADYTRNKLKLNFNYYSEQDNKNQPLQQTLTDANKLKLKSVGDSVGNAYVTNIDSLAYTASEIRYRKTDSLGYDSVFVYSTDPTKAFYRMGFSMVGKGNGDYDLTNSAANGKVYKWIAPIGKTHQGSYAPITLLIAPKRTQMYTFGSAYEFDKNTRISSEFAISNNDINTFSNLDKNNDVGYAFKTDLIKKIPICILQRDWFLNTAASYEYVQHSFTPVERYRSVEFNRDWNITSLNSALEDEQIATITAGITNQRNASVDYKFSFYDRGSQSNAYRNFISSKIQKNGFTLTEDLSYLTSRDLINQTAYLRNLTMLTKRIKKFTLGIKDEMENNQFRKIKGDTLQANSFYYNVVEAFIQNADTASNRYKLFYRKRDDFGASKGQFKQSTQSTDIGLNLGFFKNKNSSLKCNITYRTLQIKDTTLVLNNQKPDNALLSQIDYSLKLLKGTITSSTFYEIASGMEAKKVFSYIQVADGQGVYKWIDYNNDGVQQLNEFEVAVYKSDANYIRVYSISTDYIRTYSNGFNEVINLKPSVIWYDKKGVKAIISRFSSTTAYKIDRKTTINDFIKNYNPFSIKANDTSIVSLNSILRESVYFNRTNQVFGCEYNYQQNQIRTLLANGIDSKAVYSNSFSARYNPVKKITITAETSIGNKNYNSQYFADKDYAIKSLSFEPKISYQPTSSFRTAVFFKNITKDNTINLKETAINRTFGIELKYSELTKGNLLLVVNYIKINFSGIQNSSVGYEMLESLLPGNNITWNLSYQRNLSKSMQLSLMYDGRKMQDSKIVHTGNMQLRAYF